MIRRSLTLAAVAAALAMAALAGPVAASNASCTGAFASGVAALTVPFGQTNIVPEVRNLTFGGRNFGQEVQGLSRSDRSACPITP
jgi:hypothetical protein